MRTQWWLAISRPRRRQRPRVERLMPEGQLAALRFEPQRGHRLSSYVVPKVQGELLHHLRDTGFAIRISHRLRELWIRARALVAAERSDGEIAAALGVPLDEVEGL